MTSVGTSTTTDTADITMIGPRLIEQRFRPDARFSVDAFERNGIARKKVSNGKPCALLIIIPAEIPVHPPSTNQDHFRKERKAGSVLALAVVTNSEAISAVSKFYFRYHPQPFDVRVFDDEDMARTWLIDKLSEV